jgi:RNA polymerase sigma-70 factor (ECF subfamily)
MPEFLSIGLLCFPAAVCLNGTEAEKGRAVMRSALNGDDEALVQACQRGEVEAFRTLFEQYREPVFRLAYRLTGNADDAEDLAQEIFVRVFERIGTFRGESAFSTWLYRLAMNVCLNHRRQPQTRESLDVLENEPTDGAANPAAVYAQRELSEQLQTAVAALPENLRSVFVLVGMEDLSYQQAAEVLGLTVEAVRMRMSRARRTLRETLRTYMES